MAEPTANLIQNNGIAVSILYSRLATCMTKISETLPQCTISDLGIYKALQFLQYTRMAIDTIPITKCDKTLYEITNEHWNTAYKIVTTKLKAPEHMRTFTQDEIRLLHILDADLVKCIESAGLGWGEIFTITSKGETISNYIARGR